MFRRREDVWTKEISCKQVSRGFPGRTRRTKKLAPRLAAGGYTGINGGRGVDGLAGFRTYTERESEYWPRRFIRWMKSDELEKQPEKSLVLDTPGSVIYTGNNFADAFAGQMTIVQSGGFRGRAAAPDGKIFERSKSRCCGAARFNQSAGRKPPGKPWRVLSEL